MRDYRSVYRYILGLTRSGGDAEDMPLRRSSVPFTRGQVHSATIALTTGAQDDIGTLPIDGELSGISIPGASGWLWMNGGFYGTANQGVDWQDLLLERWVANGHVVDAMLTESGVGYVVFESGGDRRLLRTDEALDAVTTLIVDAR